MGLLVASLRRGQTRDRLRNRVLHSRPGKGKDVRSLQSPRNRRKIAMLWCDYFDQDTNLDKQILYENKEV